MGLDLALGAVVLLAAIRGWLRGFVSQAVRLSSFVGCFYLADPVRDQLRPYVLPRLPKVDPALMDRILWWTSAVASYVVVVGLASLAIKMMRRPDPSGLPEARRDDQFAGFLLGAAKGALVAAFLTAGLQKYGLEIARKSEWTSRQIEDSKALAWNEKYQPVPKIWEAPPVRRFVEHIQRNGLGPVPERPPQADADEVAGFPHVESPRRPPRLDIEPLDRPECHSELELERDLVEDLERIQAEIDARRAAGDWR
jgi:uncharacterized membrane protein required for colicin V production